MQSRTVQKIADRQQGVVARRQLLGAGISASAIQRALRRGALLLEYPGVYRVGHRAPSVRARYMAAVLACGEGAVLSGKAAAWLWGLIRGRAPEPEVTTRTEKRIQGLKTKRRRTLDPRDCTTHGGIPVTSVPLTLLDLTPLLPQFALARACHEAGVRYRTTPREVSEVLRRRPNAKGAAKLKAVISGDEPVVLSELEARFLTLLRAHDLPLPRTNKPAGGRRVDCRWPAQKLTVELDSYRFHNSRHSWEADRRRERQAFARGDQFRRYTYADVFERPASMFRELSALLATSPLASV